MWPDRIPFRWFYPPEPTMYEVGAFFLSHKMTVKRMKNKRRRGR